MTRKTDLEFAAPLAHNWRMSLQIKKCDNAQPIPPSVRSVPNNFCSLGRKYLGKASLATKPTCANFGTSNVEPSTALHL
eukprot:CAMPEP_0177480686 /NCGR_PEP_ID=MMETSP0369-20130122/25957_1 /TAXON_ID=447022 ORGANISM="Scrippsiella hangoei-like, Strain SHHI-4" /NCGR_SAMPLE_ID=MMETSP0369 /ASSEMBLY_ACC=CAM_ASM_000364 /LENGTH=78 /DNA_ID=CAMNT_0018956409 /DNA_START=590 /DNA_END=826 /DNA_ORIENTATION=-